jgi:hypothetical protein
LLIVTVPVSPDVHTVAGRSTVSDPVLVGEGREQLEGVLPRCSTAGRRSRPSSRCRRAAATQAVLLLVAANERLEVPGEVGGRPPRAEGMGGEEGPVVVSQPLQQLGRSLDVGEEEGDGSLVECGIPRAEPSVSATAAS